MTDPLTPEELVYVRGQIDTIREYERRSRRDAPPAEHTASRLLATLDAARADTAAPDLRSSAVWLVERWYGNRTVQPDALRADIAVLRDALRNPQALSTLESSQPAALRLLAEHAVE